MSNETTKRLSPLLRALRGRFADRLGGDRAGGDRLGGDRHAGGAGVEAGLAGGLVGGGLVGGDALLSALVRALLEWNAGKDAAGALTNLRECFVDLNELRVCTHDELAAALCDHPAAGERAARLRACLADVYRREHGMSLAALREAPKREARQYLESLDGVPRAVAARVGLEMLEIHAVPVDARLRDMLEAEGVIESGTSAEQAAAELERGIAASEVREAVVLLRAWAEVDWQPRMSGARGNAKEAKGGKSEKSEKSAKGDKASEVKDAMGSRGVKRSAKEEVKDSVTVGTRRAKARSGKADGPKGERGTSDEAKSGAVTGDEAKGGSGARKRSGKK